MQRSSADVASWVPVIGLEVHAQMRTRTKLFCGCPNRFGDPPNTNVCPVCLGLPGSLPVVNGQAFEFALKAALALNCQIARFTKQDRKNYFYPDLPKNYQISQYDLPFATRGWLEFSLAEGGVRRIGITRVHIEEDAGKLVHGAEGGGSGVDLNRAGTPLIEIVSEPDLRSALEARLYMEKLAQILEYLGVCDCNMQEGSLRCDANVSLREGEGAPFRTRREIKNMNSFRFVEAAILEEISAQRECYAAGEEVRQSTVLFNGQTGELRVMRTKEDAQDYRYFPEPDLPPIHISEELLRRIAGGLGETAVQRLSRYQEVLKLAPKDAQVLVDNKELGDFFEALMREEVPAKAAANWVIHDSQGLLRERGLTLERCGLGAREMAGLLKLVERGVINRATAKEQVFPAMLETKREAGTIVGEKGLAQVSDEGAIAGIVAEVLAAEPKLVQDYLAGKDAVANALFGRCMKRLKGQGNPGVIRPLLEQQLAALRQAKGT